MISQPLRKISFTLPEDYQHDNSNDILKERIDKLHKAMESEEAKL